MTSEPLEVRVLAVFDYAYVGGEKIKTDGLKRHTWTDITHYWTTLLKIIKWLDLI